MDIRTARLQIWHTAWLLDQGERASMESSITKTICAEAVWRVADRCVQILGGRGVTSETVVERIFRDVRARSEEHTSELQSLMRISYAVFCLKKKTKNKLQPHEHITTH